MVKWIAAFSFISTLTLAVPENKVNDLYSTVLKMTFDSVPVEHFTNKQGLRIAFRSWIYASNDKSIALVPGRSEPAIKYSEVVHDLLNLGYDVHLIDHQGQGESERLLSKTDAGHVKNFEDYDNDFYQWMSDFVAPRSQGKSLFILSHSMGGAISVRYLVQNPHGVKRAVLVAPMMHMNTHPYSEPVARLLAGALVLAGQGTKYAPGIGAYVYALDTFERNIVTHSRARHAYMKNLNKLHPELVVGGPTNLWVKQGLRATRKIDLLKVAIPILLLQAGDDKLVKLPRQTSFCQKQAQCTLHKYVKAGHEILFETDAIRDDALERIKNFLR